jgi:hypothetical protein
MQILVLPQKQLKNKVKLIGLIKFKRALISLRLQLMNTELNVTTIKFYIRIRGRVVEGTGLIIRFPMERHWFEPSRMHLKHLNVVFFQI